MLFVTVQPLKAYQTLQFDDYTNDFSYQKTSAEAMFNKQFKYSPIFVIPVKTAFDAYCHMLINQTMHGEALITFSANEYFEISMDEWHSMRRGDKRVISQIQSPIKETVVSKIYNRDVHYMKLIPPYTSDPVYNYLLYCLSGLPYYDLCNHINETPLKIADSMSDEIATLLASDKFKPLMTVGEVLDPSLLSKFKQSLKEIIMKGN